MNNVIIACDVDDVVLNLMESWLNIYNEEFSDNLKQEDITDWDISSFTKPEAKQKIYEYIETEIPFFEASPVNKALTSIRKLKEYGFRVVYVTANNPNNIKQKWLKDYGFMNENIDFVQSYDKSLIHANYLLDDKFENCVNFKYGQAWLFTRPWNKKYNFSNRVNNWDEFVNMIENKYKLESS
jgi:5'(3')-deoxyribonucleotidase